MSLLGSRARWSKRTLTSLRYDGGERPREMTQMRTLIFLCGFDPFYFRLANMAAHTVRLAGYKGDMVIFTIDERSSPYARCINLAAHPQTALVRTQKTGRCFHATLCREFGYAPYRSEIDLFLIKTLPGTIVDRQAYDFILYLDSDMLVHAPLESIFEHRTVVADFNGRKALRDVKRLAKFFTAEERALAASRNGVGGGAVGVPSDCYGFYELYRATYLEAPPRDPARPTGADLYRDPPPREFPVASLPNRALLAALLGLSQKANARGLRSKI